MSVRVLQYLNTFHSDILSNKTITFFIETYILNSVCGTLYIRCQEVSVMSRMKSDRIQVTDLVHSTESANLPVLATEVSMKQRKLK